MIRVAAEDLEILRKLVEMVAPQAEVVAFGSRVYGEPCETSDFDVAIKGATEAEVRQIKDYVAVSPRTVKIDVSRYEDMPEWLKETVDERGEKL
jgi:predicted nucleotidyltransferase